MSARRNAHVALLPINQGLVEAVRRAANKRALKDAGWAKIVDSWSDQDIMQVIGNSSTERGAIWQTAQVVKELTRPATEHFVIHGEQQDRAVQVTVAQAAARQSDPTVVAFRDYQDRLTSTPKAICGPPAKARRRRPSKAKAA